MTQPSRPDIVAANVRVYDETAESYRAGRDTYLPVMREAMKPFIRRLKDLGPDLNILDMGSGAGVHTQVLTEAGFHVTSVDASAPMLQIVRDNVPDAYCIQSDFWSFEPTIKFDGIVLASFVHLFPKEDFPRLMQRVNRWMNHNAVGWVATVTGEPQDGEWLAKESNHGHLKRWRVIYGEDELHQLLTKSGVEVVETLRLADGIHGDGKLWRDFLVQWNRGYCKCGTPYELSPSDGGGYCPREGCYADLGGPLE